MAQQTRPVNKARLEDGDTPTGSQWADLVDSFVALADSTAQTMTSDLQTPRLIATTEVSSPQVNATEVSASVVNKTILNTPLVSASAANVGILNVSTVSAAGASANMMGRFRVGSTAATMGDVVLVQHVSVPSNNTKLSMTRLPNGACILDVKMFVATRVASAATQVDVLIGTSTQDARFARFSGVTAQAFYSVPTSVQTSAWQNVSGANDTLIVVHTTAVSGAISSAASGRIAVTYYMRQGS